MPDETKGVSQLLELFLEWMQRHRPAVNARQHFANGHLRRALVRDFLASEVPLNILIDDHKE